MERKDFYRYTTIIFLIKQQGIDIDEDIKLFIKEALQLSDMSNEDIFLEVATYYDVFKK